MMRGSVLQPLAVNLCPLLQRPAYSTQQLTSHSTNHKHRQVCSHNEANTTSIQLDGGNEIGHKSAKTGMRSSLPLQVSRCQGEFIHIIH